MAGYWIQQVVVVVVEVIVVVVVVVAVVTVSIVEIVNEIMVVIVVVGLVVVVVVVVVVIKGVVAVVVVVVILVVVPLKYTQVHTAFLRVRNSLWGGVRVGGLVWGAAGWGVWFAGGAWANASKQTPRHSLSLHQGT